MEDDVDRVSIIIYSVCDDVFSVLTIIVRDDAA